MTTDPNTTDRYGSLLASGVPGDSVGRRSPWGVIVAIPLFIWGAFTLIGGAQRLLFVPAILVGFVSIGKHTTLLGVFAWALFHLVITAHGCTIIIAAISFWRMRWRRGAYAIAVGVIIPEVVFLACLIVTIAFGLAD